MTRKTDRCTQTCEDFPSMCKHLTDAGRHALALAMEEWDEIGFCPYCGARWVALHGMTQHPEMWRGGPSVYGTVWHGWSDR